MLVLMGLSSARLGTLFQCPILPQKLDIRPFRTFRDQARATCAAVGPFSTKDACQKGSVRGFFPPSYVGP